MKGMFDDSHSSSEEKSSSDSESDSQPDNEKRKKKKCRESFKEVKFRCILKDDINDYSSSSVFVIDTEGTAGDQNGSKSLQKLNKNSKVDKSSLPTILETQCRGVSEILDDRTKKILAKSVVRPGFEKVIGEGHKPLSLRGAKKLRKAEREKTKGDEWFNMPATSVNEDIARDLEIIQMRSSIDPKAHYRKPDRSVLPKYFQVGTVIASKADYYSSRLTKKERKRTIVEELIADNEFLAEQKRKYQEIKAMEAVTKRGAFQHSSYPKKRRTKAGNR
ncbi:hypothetical protein AB6A40_001712 [Gnathostoma spinigerum]|uniref:Fcf2 pre-rRNA processing C-terminal domain-containing protein n=1 Tax=Gnathostoma spinigerum TaxID=75299 RepID=A0ABD6E4Y6_9BILA